MFSRKQIVLQDFFLKANTEAYPYKGNIYLSTTRDIAPGEELLVWYGESYVEHYIHEPTGTDVIKYV